METTLMYLTGNDSRLAQDLISALSILFLSFFSVEMEDEHETESINPIQSTDGTSGEGVPGLCPPVNDGSGPLQPGKHPEAVCPQRKGIISWMAGRTEIPCSKLIEMAHLFNVTTDYLLGIDQAS